MSKEELAQRTNGLILDNSIQKRTKDEIIALYIELITYDGYVETRNIDVKYLRNLRKDRLINQLNTLVKNVLMDKSYKNIVV